MGWSVCKRNARVIITGPGDEILGSSPSRLRHLDSAAGPEPRTRRLGRRRSDYLELRDVAAVTDVSAMTAVSAVSAMTAVPDVTPVRAVRAAPRSDPAQPGRDLLAPHPGPAGSSPI